jgi:hypothetical protein
MDDVTWVDLGTLLVALGAAAVSMVALWQGRRIHQELGPLVAIKAVEHAPDQLSVQQPDGGREVHMVLTLVNRGRGPTQVRGAEIDFGAVGLARRVGPSRVDTDGFIEGNSMAEFPFAYLSQPLSDDEASAFNPPDMPVSHVWATARVFVGPDEELTKRVAVPPPQAKA